MLIVLRRARFILALILLSMTQAALASVGGWLFESNRSMEAMIAGLEEKSISVDGENWLYYVKNQTSAGASHDNCTVLIHGFTAEASHWFRFARNLVHDACLIIPDLPGYGRSDYTMGADYSIATQVQRLQQFLTQLQLAKRYHLIGSSMGGHIAGLYTLQFPSDVMSLTLINSGGVLTPAKSKMDIQVEETGVSIFEVESIEQFKAVFEMTLSDPPWMPSLVLNHVGQNAINRTERHRLIFSQIYQKDLLDEQLANINTPTLILWGEEDQLLHLSMAEVFQKNIPASTLILIPKAGHLPFLEKPATSADIYNRFISNILK